MSLTAGQIPESCKILTFDQAIEPVTDEGRRVDRSDYLSEGSLPVIDQGEEFIGGYTNDTNQRYNGPLPVIVFGDHTRRVKLIDFPFVVGAQGVKLLKPKDCWEPRFLAYLLPTLPLQNRGYGRHYQYLRQLKFLCPPKSNQREIVAEIKAIHVAGGGSRGLAACAGQPQTIPRRRPQSRLRRQTRSHRSRTRSPRRPHLRNRRPTS